MFDLLKICNGDLKQFCFTKVELLSVVKRSSILFKRLLNIKDHDMLDVEGFKNVFY